MIALVLLAGCEPDVDLRAVRAAERACQSNGGVLSSLDIAWSDFSIDARCINDVEINIPADTWLDADGLWRTQHWAERPAEPRPAFRPCHHDCKFPFWNLIGENKS